VRHNEDALLVEGYLDCVHQYHWEQCQLLALSLTVGITMQWSSAYEVSWCWPVFVAAREGNISALRRLSDAGQGSPFDRIIAGMNLLEILLITLAIDIKR
jgi:hypothetical protein